MPFTIFGESREMTLDKEVDIYNPNKKEYKKEEISKIKLTQNQLKEYIKNKSITDGKFTIQIGYGNLDEMLEFSKKLNGKNSNRKIFITDDANEPILICEKGDTYGFMY